MHMSRGVRSGCLIAALVASAGGAFAKPENGEKRDKLARMTAVKSETPTSMKVVTSNERGGSKTVEVQREKTEDGIQSTRHATVTTANGTTVVNDDTWTRTKTENGSQVSRSGKSTVIKPSGESKTATRSSLSTRDGKTVTRVSASTGPEGRTRSVNASAVGGEGGVKLNKQVKRRDGSTVTRSGEVKVEKTEEVPSPGTTTDAKSDANKDAKTQPVAGE
jgi:hypothetical protein